MHFSPMTVSVTDAADDLHRQLAAVADLAQRLFDAAAEIPVADAGAAWWGPSREAVQGALDIERERVQREALRAEAIVDQVRVRVMETSGVLPSVLP